MPNSDGSDIPADWSPRNPRGSPIALFEYIEHLMGAADGRYAAHPTLAFALNNIKQREQSMRSTSFNVNQDPEDNAMTADDVRDILRDDPARIGTLAKRITAWTSGTADTPAYWWQRRKEVGAMVRDIELTTGALPFAFHSGSIAEYHMPGLHNCLHQYLQLVGREDAAAVVEHLRTRQGTPHLNSDLNVHAVLLQTPAVLNRFFHIRTASWFKIVLGEGLGIDDFWYR